MVDIYKGVFVCGYTRVCNHVDIHTQRYSVQISTVFHARYMYMYTFIYLYI